jgi:hypothetical protein
MSDPIFWPLAGRRSMAIEMVPDAGSAGLRGTGMVAHWNPFSPDPVQGSH